MEKTVKIPINGENVEGFLAIPQEAKGIVIFAHGSGSSRFSSRNQFVAQELRQNGFGTLLFDLLTQEEDMIYENRFDINLLATRLALATQWLVKQGQASNLPIGYFGASTGTAAALKAALEMKPMIKAVVSRGGRPDLAEEALSEVETPTLFIVGGNDRVVLELNKEAQLKMRAVTRLTIVPRATHLFEETGALEEVARLAAGWVNQYLRHSPSSLHPGRTKV